MLPKFIQRYNEKSFHFWSSSKWETHWDLTGCQKPHFMILLILYIILLNLSWIKKCLFWRNMEPLIYSEGQRLNLKVPFKRAAGIILDFFFFFFFFFVYQQTTFQFFFCIYFSEKKNIINNLHVLALIGMETKPQTLLNKTRIQVMLEDNITRKKEEKTRGPRATTRSPEWNCHCRYADGMQHFSNTLMTRQWLKQFLKWNILLTRLKRWNFQTSHVKQVTPKASYQLSSQLAFRCSRRSEK